LSAFHPCLKTIFLQRRLSIGESNLNNYYMRILSKWIACIAIVFFGTAAFAQSRPAAAEVNAGDVIEKITTNPASSFSNEPNGRDNDGSALIYLNPAWQGKVAEVTYHVRDLPNAALNPLIHIRATGNVISVPGLRRNIYEITEVKLLSGKTIKLKSFALPINSLDRYSRNIFVVYTIDPQALPEATFADLQSRLEGSRVENLRNALSAGNRNTGRIEPTAANASNCDYSTWHVVAIQPVWYNNTYTLRLQNDCSGVQANFVCISIHNGNGDSYIGETFYWVSGTSCGGDLHLRPTSSSQYMGIIGTAGCCPAYYLTPTNATICEGQSATISASGAVTYTWNTGQTGSSITVSPTFTTTYYVMGTNSQSCISEWTAVTVTVNPKPAAPSATVINPTCTVPTGTITITAVAGATYSFNGGVTYQASNVKSGLAPGTYQLRIRSAAGCESNSTLVTIAAAPATPAAPSATVTDPTCTVATGTITITAVTGATYSFDNGATYQASNVKSGLAPGTYQLKIKNAAGCESAATAKTIAAAPATPAAPVATVTDPTCTVSTGTITITSVAGATYSFDNGVTYQASNVKSGLAPGTYQLKIKNAAGCESAATAKTIAVAPAAITVAVSGNQTVCSSTATTLTATATPSAGATFIWREGSASGPVVSNTATLTVLPPAATTYFVTATSLSGCTDTKSILVNAPRPALTLTNIVTICKGQSTDVRADNGGIAGYTYRWLAPASVAGNTNPVLLNQTPLVTTDYTVERRSTAGCLDTATSTIRVMEQPVLGTTAVTNASCTGANNGSITINASSPSGLVMEYSIDGTTWQTSNVFSNLAPGTYSVLVRNQNAVCQAVTGSNVTITRLSGPVSSITGPIQRCANEELRFDAAPVSGGTYNWSVTNNGTGTAAPVITGGNTSPSFTVTFAANTPASASRTERVTLTVSLNGCTSTYTQDVNVTQAIFANAGPDTSVCRGGQLFIGLPAAQAGPLGATFQWAPADKIQGTTTASQFTTTALTADQEYILTVTDPNNGCTRTDRVFVTVNTNRNPVADAGTDKLLLAAQTAVLGGPATSVSDASAIVSYTWNTLLGVGQQLDTYVDPNPTFTMPSPASLYTYELLVRKQYRSTSTTPGLVCFARDTVNILKLTIGSTVPDLTPTITILPAISNGTTNVLQARITVKEVLGVNTTTQPVYVSIPASQHYTVNPYNSTTTNVYGLPVQNSNWTYLGLFNGRHFFQYIGTAPIPANGTTSFGINLTFNSNGTSGKENVVVAILDGSGGETNFLNNYDDETIVYSSQDQ
jgi:hypothetical protein